MAKILITGIYGAAGSYLSEYILDVVAPESQIIGVTRNKNCLVKLNDKIQIYNIDLCDFSSVFRMLKKEKPDMIFHLASSVSVGDSFVHPMIYIQNNTNLTLNLFESIRLIKDFEGYNPTVQIGSTSEVYGNVNGIITESSPMKPINPYAVSKVTQDNLAYVYSKNYNLNIIIVRMFSYFNARRDNLAPSSFARQIIDIEQGKQTVLKHGDLSSKRTILDFRDVVSAYWSAMTKCQSGEAYNIAADEVVSMEDVLNQLVRYAKCPIKCETSSTLMRPTDIRQQIPDTSKFKQATGWQPKYNLEQSVQFFFQEVRKYYEKT